MLIDERYAGAINARSLKSDPRSSMSDTDVLAAVGLAGIEHPLGTALKRLFAGDHRASHQIVEMLAVMAFDQSWKLRVKLTRIEANDMARKCLAWHRNSACASCGGLGYTLVPGTPTLSDHQCPACAGTGRLDFDGQFAREHLQLARWLDVQMARESGRAGTAAMARLAREMDL